MTRFIDLRSDTVTQPTDEMRRAMMEAEVGDDILGEDPTVDRLEALAAKMLGKEAGLFLISGTMANQVAIMAATLRGDEILVSETSHIYNLEVSGLAALSGVQARPLRSDRGRFDLHEVRKAIRPKGIQSAVTRLICFENTFDLNRGIPLPADYVSEVMAVAHERGVSGYMDGARLFNAAVALGVPASDLTADVDAVMICLSKGLCAPVGSILAGSVDFIDRARWVRQRIGGGMRQAGHMAATGIVALEKMVPRIAEDHANARLLIAKLNEIRPGLVEPTSGQTNVIQASFESAGKTAQFMADELLKRNVKVKPIGDWACRMITHLGIGPNEVEQAVQAIEEVLQGM